MCSAVFVLSLLVAMDPVRIGITALLISRPRPILNLFAFWLGGMAAGISVALVVLLFLRDFTLPLIREVVSALSSPTVAGTAGCDRCAGGVIAARSLGRQRVPVPATGGEAAVSVLEPDTVDRIRPTLDPRPTRRRVIGRGVRRRPRIGDAACRVPGGDDRDTGLGSNCR